ncbi:hypothetical protein LDENG_00175760 [Lucifuga dentata]|nr:hypothetical protein LDENG_00175760 [Lucifuga dentata]
MAPSEVEVWTRQQREQLAGRAWPWNTEGVAEWVLSQREQQLKVSEETLLQKARRALGEDTHLSDCYRWVIDLMLRHELRPHPPIAISRQKRTKNIEESSRNFIHSLCTQIMKENLQPRSVGTVDTLSLYVDLDLFAALSPSAFQLLGTPEQAPLFEVVLSGLQDGTFFTPMLFFTGAAPQLPVSFPHNVLMEAHPAGFTRQQRLLLWLHKVWHPHVVQSDSRSLLIVDSQVKEEEEFLSGLRCVPATVPALIPPTCCCRLQPLLTCVTPVLQDFLQMRWSQLVTHVGVGDVGVAELAVRVAWWLSEAASTLQTETNFLQRSFSIVCTPLQKDHEEPSRMIRDLSEALLRPPPDQGAEQKKVTSLHRVFESESDAESFHGFEDE